MRDQGILFKSEMVRAILAGTKTQTRRVLSLQRAVGEPDAPPGHVLEVIYPGSVQHYGYVTPTHDRPSWRVQRLCDDTCNHYDDVGPYDGRHVYSWGPLPYATGMKLWVRETWQAWRQTSFEYDEWEVESDAEAMRNASILYKATSTSVGPWRSPIFMPRWASRITLEVTDVRVQRLQDITDDDARAEGVDPYTPPMGCISPDQRVPGPGLSDVGLVTSRTACRSRTCGTPSTESQPGCSTTTGTRSLMTTASR